MPKSASDGPSDSPTVVKMTAQTSYHGQDCRGRSFRGASFDGADFTGADVRGADFTRASLVEADFTDARIGVQPLTGVCNNDTRSETSFVDWKFTGADRSAQGVRN